MHVVAIDRVSGDPTERAQALAQVLDRTPYECRPRVQAPRGGPAVIATHPDAASAHATAARARAAGFCTLVLDAAAATPSVRAFPVRAFRFEAETLEVSTRDGRTASIPWPSVDRIVQGTAMTQQRHTEKVKERKLSVGRAVLSGGLLMSRTQSSERTSTTTQTERFVALYAGEAGPWWLAESELDYRSLGPAMQPSRLGNHAFVLSRLREAASAATWDDRLDGVAAQRHLLGPTLNVEDNLDLAIVLVAASLGL